MRLSDGCIADIDSLLDESFLPSIELIVGYDVKRLKHYERSIFELKEFVDSKSRETDYELVKGTCLQLVNKLNKEAIQASQHGGGNFYDAQAKGKQKAATTVSTGFIR